MQQLFQQFLIFKQIDQLNLKEYCFYAQDNEQHLCFIYIDEDSVEIEITEFELNQLIQLSSYKIQCLDVFNQRVQKIFSKITPQDEKEIICSISLDQIFINRKTQEIIIPKYIQNQIQKSKYRDLFIQNFLQDLMYYVVKDQNDFLEENKLNIQIMKKIVEQKLDLNDKVSDVIKQLFETFLYVSIEQIKQVSKLKNGKYYFSQFNYDQDDYIKMKQIYKNYLLDRKRIPDQDLKQIKEFFSNKLLPKDVNKIAKQIIEIQNYHEKKQSGLRLTATKMYDICQYQKYKQEVNQIENEATQYGQAHEKIALEKYAKDHSNIKLKYTDVLINQNYPYICGKPDALIYDIDDNLVGIIEVKSPFSKKDLDLNKDENFNLNYIEMNQDKNYCIKMNHQYYYQVQVYLLITELSCCVFIISTTKGNREIIVKKDEGLINQIKKKAENYYLTQILPNQCQLQKKIIEQDDLIRIKEIIGFN